MQLSGAHHGVPIGDRELVEEAIALLCTAAPAGWSVLHGEFEPSHQPPVAVAQAVTDSVQQSISVPAGVTHILAEHQRRAAEAGAPWRRLTIECHSDGRLSVRADPAETDPEVDLGTGGARKWRPLWLRWLRMALVAVTVGALIATAVVVGLARPWSPPPRADIIEVPPPSARERQAHDVIVGWYEAHNRGDTAAMRALACVDPKPNVPQWITSIERDGSDGKLYFPEVVAEFREQGSQVWVRFASRIRPLTDAVRPEVEDAQRTGGFFKQVFSLEEQEGGVLKICNVETES
ncbi:hypothetical protein HBE99_19590 [Mycobacteroides chelonae]|uniref:hypothetical protein n=1 Tax=Mycobacteroides chelonae TaxID=1774 RepID=UPI001910C659|nr:hypothetical protein [Mycobacteroides chelonae]QQG98781.1 hypothetical protein HBE99_19590 [Mycobacteroides chelonae]